MYSFCGRKKIPELRETFADTRRVWWRNNEASRRATRIGFPCTNEIPHVFQTFRRSDQLRRWEKKKGRESYIKRANRPLLHFVFIYSSIHFFSRLQEECIHITFYTVESFVTTIRSLLLNIYILFFSTFKFFSLAIKRKNLRRGIHCSLLAL